MDRWHAPEAAASAWRFMRAAGTYDWPGVAAELTPQLDARTAGRTWLPVDLLRDAGVLALLRTGERERAQKVFISLARASARGFDRPADGGAAAADDGAVGRTSSGYR